ncbi:hypothetical protein MNAN1_001527 [Malassezia nana]|uniref:Xylanolytic transcriptional activator regulatory domain-containing protein n=1 Tax=Malassezia nana TaxID=180528 RepID=A0AAF0J241_9BASI|nr:hypothetical protein MNAN1_001527 [Malassezia nana]
MMDNVGIVFRKRNARPPKNLNRLASGEKPSDEKPTPSMNLANNRFDLAMASLDSADNDVEAFKVDNWLMNQNMWNPMGSLPSSLPGAGVNGSVPSTDSTASQPAMGMKQSATMPAPALPSILSESNVWMSNTPFANATNSMMNMNETGGTPSLNSVVSSSASGSLGKVTDQDFAQMARPSGPPSFESTTQGTPDLSLLTKPMALGADVPTTSTGLMLSNSVPIASSGHVEAVKHVISDPNGLSKLSELSTRTMLEYSRTHNINSSVTANAGSATSMLLTSPSSDRGSELDACCVRVLNAEGDLAYWPQHNYYSSLVDYYQRSIGSTELPGGTQYKDQLDGSFELFPLRQHWQESHFQSLKNQSQALLRKMPVLTLIRMALKDVSASLPFLQWNDMETYVSVFTLSSVNMAWTPLQVRQRQSLLLLLCALASSLVPAVHVTTHVDSTALSALPWELGMKCFQLARGLLHPVMGQMQADESSLEFIQCMILMVMFILRCQDKQRVWSPLAHGNAVSLHLLANAAATNVDMAYSVVEREMLKRCVWMLFMLEIDTRVDKDGVQPLSLWSSFPFKLEQPVSLTGFHTAYGPADMGFTRETLERFKSQTELCQIMLSVLLLRLHEPVPRTEEVMEVARALQHELTKWASHTPCLIHTDTTTTTTPLAQAWQPPSVIPFPALYEACTFYLARVHE